MDALLAVALLGLFCRLPRLLLEGHIVVEESTQRHPNRADLSANACDFLAARTFGNEES